MGSYIYRNANRKCGFEDMLMGMNVCEDFLHPLSAFGAAAAVCVGGWVKWNGISGYLMRLTRGARGWMVWYAHYELVLGSKDERAITIKQQPSASIETDYN